MFYLIYNNSIVGFFKTTFAFSILHIVLYSNYAYSRPYDSVVVVVVDTKPIQVPEKTWM